MRSRRKAGALTFCCWLFGCGTPPPQPVPTFTPLTIQRYPPTLGVEVLYNRPRDRSFVELGEISIRLTGSNVDHWIDAVRNKAQEIGADAIVILGPTGTDEPMGSGDALPRNLPATDMLALAIRYADRRPQN